MNKAGRDFRKATVRRIAAGAALAAIGVAGAAAGTAAAAPPSTPFPASPGSSSDAAIQNDMARIVRDNATQDPGSYQIAQYDPIAKAAIGVNPSNPNDPVISVGCPPPDYQCHVNWISKPGFKPRPN